MYRSCLLLCILISGCSKIPPSDDGFVACTVSDRIGAEVEWRQGCCQEEEVTSFITSALESELTTDTAIQIALLNNPKIQATFEELGIARADLIEAGLLSNPFFELEIRFPRNIEYLITSSLLDIFLIPLRTQVASLEFEQTKLRVSNEILNLAFEVRETYYELVAEKKKINIIHSIVELTSIISEITAMQVAAGNVNSLEFELAQAHLLEAEMELLSSQTEVIVLREKMHRLLGLTENVCLILPEELPEIDASHFDLCTLETIALQERLDLKVSRFEIARDYQMLGLKSWWTYTNLRAGLAGEREPNGTNLIGPGFSFELPIFNYGQAATLRLLAQVRQANDRYLELEIHVLSEVREAYHLLMSYLKIIHDYQFRLLPMQSQISTSSEALYNVMGLGIDQLLENKRQEIIAAKNYIEIMKKYLIAQVKMDRALGGNLSKNFY